MAKEPQGRHHLRRDRRDPHPVDVAASADHGAGDRRCRDRGGGSRRRDRASACARPENRQARSVAGGVCAVSESDQAAQQLRGQHHHRRRADHDGRRARAPGRDLQAGSRLAQHGLDEFRSVSDARPLQGFQARLGEALSRRLLRAHLQEHLRRHRIYSDHLRRKRHALRDRVLRHRSSLHARLFPRARPGEAAAVRAVGVRHSRRHRHASGRRRAYEAHRRPAVRQGLSLVGARRRAQSAPDRGMAAAMGGNVRVGLEDSLWIGPGQLAKSNADQVRRARAIIENLGPRDRDARTRRAKS